MLHFMGGIHAVEHAAIGIFPLLVLTDRNDLGGISITYHPQVACAAIFIYDGIPGGAGLCRQAYQRAEDLLHYTFKAIDTCPCESGCPSCVHSPKCGSGNRPIDKTAARFILERMMADNPVALAADKRPAAPQKEASPKKLEEHEPLLPGPMRKPRFKQRVKRQRPSGWQPEKTLSVVEAATLSSEKVAKALRPVRFGVFDVETQRSAQEVGGWHRADLMRISCAVVYDSQDDEFMTFQETQIPELITCLGRFDLVVGFNIKRFDYSVLSGYSDQDFSLLPTLDLLEEVHKRLGYRLSLDSLARETLGRHKSADGLQALQWWKEGRIDDIVEYCRQDVEITRDLFHYGRVNGYLLFKNKAGNSVRVPVDW
jgi:DEAD/DEAH box helicase domain-containing protein